jgi:two-component sensor histidine kinase
LKHAFPGGRAGEIHIALKSTAPESRILTIQDNGVGLPEELQVQKVSTLGMQLIIELVNQLRGTLELVRDKGTAFIVKF